MNNQKKDKLVLKTIVAMVVLLIFFFIQGAIVVITGMEGIQSAVVRGTVLWSLVIITLLFYFIRYKGISRLGFCKIESGVQKRLLYYIPLLIISFSHFTAGFDLGGGASFVFANIFLTLGIGMAEEIFFRGIICNIWIGRGTLKAMVISAVLFGLSHLLNVAGGADLTSTILQICFAFIYGMVFALIFIEQKSLIPCILLHALHDFCSYISADGSLKFNIILGTIQFVILIAYLIYLVTQTKFIKQKKC